MTTYAMYLFRVAFDKKVSRQTVGRRMAIARGFTRSRCWNFRGGTWASRWWPTLAESEEYWNARWDKCRKKRGDSRAEAVDSRAEAVDSRAEAVDSRAETVD